MTNQEFEVAIGKIRQGDKQGLQEIYEAYVGLIYAIVKDILKNKESAEDVTSDFFIKLWDKADCYQSGKGHKAWMTVIARNMAVDYIRKYHKEESSEFVNDMDAGVSALWSSESDNPVEQKVIADVSIKEALSVLKEKERQIMNMKILGEMTFKEIAQALNIPMGTVTWRYKSAVNKLRRCGYETGF